MSAVAAYDAIKLAVSAAIGAAVPVLDYEEVDQSMPGSYSSFLAIEEGGGDERLETIGAPSAGVVRETATIVIHIFTETATSYRAHRVIADQIRDALRYQDQPVAAPDNLRILAIGPIFPRNFTEGLWRESEFEMSYAFDMVRRIA